ncbi:hypothetical protein SAMN04487949_2562 [Halogranum gelatinilyticum]|uniref:Proteasome lid subunit RPN8/RPN11, contains Jab1/MPN metalloenzyme (JAMM) motif n=1 Tax=Halogranum gelatinilyticum TaxID=660521 RepID=A0A1G9VZ64_9EURY|nr:hypothetical protein SAMN04487949_2562 [Halogranum gelatinilyticum]
MIYVTRGLVDVLLDLAEDAEPNALDITLASTPARNFESDLDLDPETPVLTHFYLPDAGRSVGAVFGMDLGTPAGSGKARFITHPQGKLVVTKRDHLAAVMLLAVPPWDERSYAAFDRSGRQLDLSVLDAEPPQESLA